MFFKHINQFYAPRRFTKSSPSQTVSTNRKIWKPLQNTGCTLIWFSKIFSNFKLENQIPLRHLAKLDPLSAHPSDPVTGCAQSARISFWNQICTSLLKTSLNVKKDLTKLSSTRQTHSRHAKPSTQNDIPVKLMPTEPVDLLAASRLQWWPDEDWTKTNHGIWICVSNLGSRIKPSSSHVMETDKYTPSTQKPVEAEIWRNIPSTRTSYAQWSSKSYQL